MDTPLQRSPLDQVARQAGAEFAPWGGWDVAQRYPGEPAPGDLFASGRSVALVDESANSKLVVEGRGAAAFLGRLWNLPELDQGRSAAAGPGRVYRLRLDQYLLHAPPGSGPEAMAVLEAGLAATDGIMALTDITPGRAEVLLVGPDSAALLSRLCGLDFSAAQFPPGMALFTSVAKTRQLLIRADIDLLPAYRLVGARSLAIYLWETIMTAGQDLGITPLGRLALAGLG